MASARAATDWSANVRASSVVTPDLASPLSQAKSASARDRSNRVSMSRTLLLPHSRTASRKSGIAAIRQPHYKFRRVAAEYESAVGQLPAEILRATQRDESE